MKKLILVRGHPGSGKSTYAKAMCYAFPDAAEVCADYFFELIGKYAFKPNLLKDAHEWCFRETFTLLNTNDNVFVHNTFTKLWEMQKYIDKAKEFGVEVQIVKMNGDFQNVHGVPEKKVQQMKDNYEPHPDETIVQIPVFNGSQI